jgi:hypothetical protein
MSTSTPTPESKPAPRRSWFHRIVVFLLITAGLVAVLYALEDWRGNRAWKKYEQAAKAQGMPLDWRTDWPKRRLSTEPLKEGEFPNCGITFELASQLMTPSGIDREFEDLVAWEQAIKASKSGQTPGAPKATGLKIETGDMNAAHRARAAAAVLQMFKEDEAFLDKVRAKCHRPDPLYPFGGEAVAQNSIFPSCPNVFRAINLARMLRVKDAAELAVGNNAAALRDLDLLLSVSESLRNDPQLISQIGHLATLSIGLRFPWEGLARRQFTESELKQLQAALGSDDLIAICHRAVLDERASALPLYDQVKKDVHWPRVLGLTQRDDFYSVFSFIPAGWIMLDKLNYARSFDSILAAAYPSSGKRQIAPAQLGPASAAVQKQLRASKAKHILRHTLLFAVMMPKLEGAIYSSCRVQVTRDLMKLACGLERYYLKHTNYPEKLDQIVPEFLAEMPTDPFTGDAYRYGREPNGRYKIWSVGWNEKDDGGVAGSKSFEDYTGDWVWQYP